MVSSWAIKKVSFLFFLLKSDDCVSLWCFLFSCLAAVWVFWISVHTEMMSKRHETKNQSWLVSSLLADKNTYYKWMKITKKVLCESNLVNKSADYLNKCEHNLVKFSWLSKQMWAQFGKNQLIIKKCELNLAIKISWLTNVSPIWP